MSYEIRWLRTDEWDECLDLLAEVMEASRGYFSDSFKQNGTSAPSLICVVDGEIASHIRIFDTHKQVGGCLVRAANIGDVCTHPRHRGRGYMTALLNVAAQQLYLQGYDISVVHSGVPIYQKGGWVAFPEPEQYLLWRLINITSLFARIAPVFEARAAKMAKPYQGVIAVFCNGQRAFVEFTKQWVRPLDHCSEPSLTLDLDQLTFFRLLMGRDTPAELDLPARLSLSDRDAEVLAALFPKRRPEF
ncbi:MAG: GNAT family N-acetyltransferase [Armatimonadota bacterium]|nr:MAG: GNAT family N-acetyltransferase [Armatimonadota bacterium]